MDEVRSEMLEALEKMYELGFKPQELEIIIPRRVVIEPDPDDKTIITFAGVPVTVDPSCPPDTWYIKQAER